MEVVIMAVTIIIVGIFTFSISYINILSSKNLNTESKFVKKVLKNPGKYAMRAELAITTLEFLISGIAVELYAKPLIESISNNTNLSYMLIKYIAILVITIISAYITTIVGKYIPKYLAIKNGSKKNKYTLWFFYILSIMLLPFTIIVNITDSIVKNIFKTNIAEETKKIEVIEFTNVEYEKGVIKKYQKDIMDRIIKLSETRLCDIYTKFDDVMSIEINSKLEDILSFFKKHEFSRIPVYENEKNNIIGVLYIKDILFNLKELESGKLKIKDIIKLPLYEDKKLKLSSIIRKMKKSKIHIVVVLDQDKTIGIFTFNDAIEKFMGDTRDEFDIKNEK